MKTIKLFLSAFLMLITIAIYGQKYMVTIPVTQQDDRLHVTVEKTAQKNADSFYRKASWKTYEQL